MVLRITVERDYTIEDSRTDAYTVHVESHRILTVFTCSDLIATKWLKQALKSSLTKTTVLVGVSAETDYPWGYRRNEDVPYDILCLNIGSQSLIYGFPYDRDKPARFLLSFFQDPRVFPIGHGMAELSRKLKLHHRIQIQNAVDVNHLAVKGLKRDDLDLGRFGLDRLAKAVLGKRMDVFRPEEEVEWYVGESWSLRSQKVKFCTVDIYLCFLIGLELIDAIDGAAGPKKKKKNSS
ncbi:hypothetical protein L3X38_023396 [Prunus dulcis]|uniref:3'-5' exonuclease domain-containing protein n=1 Tax=Prunus dulcis TaxID=3755 RepID=A0AAD4VYQ2_PRUDU|nr:hypothetical protein L3X38_023396 [Prunus dulcis]